VTIVQYEMPQIQNLGLKKMIQVSKFACNMFHFDLNVACISDVY